MASRSTDRGYHLPQVVCCIMHVTFKSARSSQDNRMDRKPRDNVCQCAQDKFFKLYRDICQRKTRFMNKPAPANQRYQPTHYEHAANCATHAVCIFPSIVGSTVLHLLSNEKWHSLAALLYGAGLCGLFIVSTIFHTVTWKTAHLQTIEHCLHMCDRVVIYIFIAASYTPWLLLRQLGPWGVPMRWFVWVMACAGTFYVILYHERYKVLELLCYLTMGFAPLVAIFSMVEGSMESTIR
uniref:monocyte to macrophage differentiation factor 2-like isoform X2 n=1 Tax=Myxine glutinosa TaxID=7769 RepID=UPI00358E497C